MLQQNEESHDYRKCARAVPEPFGWLLSTAPDSPSQRILLGWI